ncbi:hypothetical protein K438DRAFT_913391 [Mycena galopus ATCC 62051]|nr:hypothetical protein K438DRAFT_913391 [Mycena galopus ATCC 62051]
MSYNKTVTFRTTRANSRPMDSDSSVLSVACRFLPHDQWFTTHVSPAWEVKQVKSWLLGCLPHAPRTQFTLIRFSTGQLLEDNVPLSFYDIQAHELLELHRSGVVVPLARAHPARYLDAYWEGRVRMLRMQPGPTEGDEWGLYKVRETETRALEWCERWLVVREGNVYLCRNETCLIYTLPLSDLIQLTDNGLPRAAAAMLLNKTRVVLARFAPGSSSRVSTHMGSTTSYADSASFPGNPLDSDFSSDSSNLSSPIFSYDSGDSSRKRQQRLQRRVEPEFFVLDLEDDAAYDSLLRVLHRHALPRSDFVDTGGTAKRLSAHRTKDPSPSDTADLDNVSDPDNAEDTLLLRHPSSLRTSPHLRSLEPLPFPEWRTALLHRARCAGLGRINKALEWVLWNGSMVGDDGWESEGGVEEGWMLNASGSPFTGRRRGKGRPRESLGRETDRRERGSSDEYDSDVSGDGLLSDPEGPEGQGGSEDDEDSDSRRKM